LRRDEIVRNHVNAADPYRVLGGHGSDG
jgi:hypothetical protein